MPSIVELQAPNHFPPKDRAFKVFLAGGITGCPDWQAEVIKDFKERCQCSRDLILLNPRRANFPINDPDASFVQIEWEHDALADADAILFWFPCETMCPIVLFELGAWSKQHNKKIFVGVHPNYQRRQDVEIQMALERPSLVVKYDLRQLANDVVTYVRGY